MIPTVEKLMTEVQKAIGSPIQALTTKAVSEGTKAAGKVAGDSLKSDISVNQKIAEFKDKNVVNSEDIAFACALVDILYSRMLDIRVNNVPLRKARPDNDSFPAAFLLLGPDAVRAADKDLHKTAQTLRIAKIAFETLFPACVAAITAKEYMDLKSLAGKFSSMIVADGMLISDAIRTCKNGVEIVDKGLLWVKSYDKTLDQWLASSKSAHAS